MAHAEDEMRAKEEEFKKTKEELEKISGIKKQLEEQNVTLTQAKNDLFLELQAEQVSHLDMEMYNFSVTVAIHT